MSSSTVHQNISRRRLLQLASVGAGGILLGGGLVGCSSGDGDVDEDVQLPVLTVGVPDLPGSLDPIVGLGNSTSRIFANVFETLIYADQRQAFEMEPMLATSYERIDDRTIRFTLADGVLFHDGTEMTAADVEYSFERVKDGPDGSELAASLMTEIERVEIIDDHIFEVIATQADPILEQRIASTWGSWILPKDYLESEGDEGFARAPVGTGPYQVESMSPERVVLSRFEDYHGAAPLADTIEYVLYPEDSPRVTALMTGEVDMIAQLPMEQVSIVEERAGVRALTIVMDGLQMLRINTSAPGLTDPRLRQALSLAIDRDLIIESLWEGTAEIPNGHQFPSYGDLYIEDYPQVEYDQDRARALVEESDYDGEVIDYEVNPGYYPFDTSIADVVIGMWSEIGVSAQVVYSDSFDYTGVATWSNGPRFPDPAGGLWLLWGPESSAHNWWDGDEEFDEIGQRLSAEMDPEQRRDLARQLMERWDEVAPGILLNRSVNVWGIRDGLDWQPNPNHTMDFFDGKIAVE